jgi:DNA topoisomerase-2
VSLSEGQFEQVTARYVSARLLLLTWLQFHLTCFFVFQVSFVNGIATTRGGSHVDYVANKIATHVAHVVNDKKSKNTHAEVHDVKRHLWLFVNARIQNPTFDSQTKDFLTTPYESFGSKCDFSDVFLDKGM